MSDLPVGAMFGADIQGPFRVPSLSNNTYVFALIDYKSRRVWQYFISHKDAAYDCIKDFIDTEIERLLYRFKDLGVITLISDGGELHSNKAARFCAKYNVTQGFTCTNTPENNQFIERVWGTLADMTTCMLEDSQRPEAYWEEARKHSQYIYNRVPATRKPEVGPWLSPQTTF